MDITNTRDLSFMQDFDKFKALLEQGRHYMRLGCERLAAAGVPNITFPEELPPIRDRDDFDAIAKYSAKEKDSLINGRLCEWKSRDYGFVSPADFPFATAFIDTVNSIDLKERMPDYYIFISQKTLSILAIGVDETREWWRREWAFDRVRRHNELFYTCPKRLLMDEAELIRRLKPV